MGTDPYGLSKLLQGVAMNLMEFLFAVTAVSGSTTLIVLWQYLIYKLDQDDSEEVENQEIRLVKQKEA